MVDLAVPRERSPRFEPQVVANYARRRPQPDRAVISSSLLTCLLDAGATTMWFAIVDKVAVPVSRARDCGRPVSPEHSTAPQE